MKEKIKSNALYLVMAVVLAFLIVVPILTVFARAIITDGQLNFADAIATICDSENLETIGNSLLLGVLVVITSTLIATPLAFILTRTKFARKKWLDIVLMIPFMTPPYISSMGWILFTQRRGLFQQLFPSTGTASEIFSHWVA